MTNRKFIIKIISQRYNTDLYVKKVTSNFIGYYFSSCKNIKNAKTWKYRKSCEKNIKLITEKLDPTKPNLKNLKFEIIEITELKILRNIKLKKLK